jgi:argininosuccinate lyase
MAHVLTLRETGIMTKDDAAIALRALTEIDKEIEENGFPYRPELGAQLGLEAMIVDRVGEGVGLQIHTGRSRNDQVLVAQKLHTRDRILELMELALRLVRIVATRADEEKMTIMPGYTHMQPARPTTVGQWFATFTEGYLRDLERLRDAYVRHNTSPLGAADSYASSWPLDREFTAQLLAFDRADQISIDIISSRGESETDFLSSLSFFATRMSKAAVDLLLFTTYEYGYAQLTEAVAERMGKLTGSSIMPQKKNPDVLELLRAQVSEVHSYLFHCLELLKALPVGYNRDSRDTKGPIIRGVQSVKMSTEQMINVVAGVEFNEEKMLQAVKDNYCMATDLAEWMAQRCHIPFRIVHRIVGRTVKSAVASNTKLYDVPLSTFQAEAETEGYALDITEDELAAAIDPTDAVQRRTNLGGPSEKTMNAWVAGVNERISSFAMWLTSETDRVRAARENIRERALAGG